jgi:hypothetical protein
LAIIGEKIGVFSKNNIMINFLHNLALPKFLVENIFKNHNIGPWTWLDCRCMYLCSTKAINFVVNLTLLKRAAKQRQNVKLLLSKNVKLITFFCSTEFTE